MTTPARASSNVVVWAPGWTIANCSQTCDRASNHRQRTKRIKKLPKLKGLKEILYPGENKLRRFKKNSKSEIQIPTNIKEDIRTLLK